MAAKEKEQLLATETTLKDLVASEAKAKDEYKTSLEQVTAELEAERAAHKVRAFVCVCVCAYGSCAILLERHGMESGLAGRPGTSSERAIHCCAGVVSCWPVFSNARGGCLCDCLFLERWHWTKPAPNTHKPRMHGAAKFMTSRHVVVVGGGVVVVVVVVVVVGCGHWLLFFVIRLWLVRQHGAVRLCIPLTAYFGLDARVLTPGLYASAAATTTTTTGTPRPTELAEQ